MAGKRVLNKLWSWCLGEPLGDDNYWIDKHQMPIGTTQPYEVLVEKFGDINDVPEKFIVTIPFDPVDTPLVKRNAMNILLLAGSGDGKSVLMKLMWSVLHQAGFYCMYIDPKSTDSGRARIKWENSPRIPPRMKPKGIKLQHFMPAWATRGYDHMLHNFRIYATRLSKINEKEMWQGLGMRSVGASAIMRIMRRYGDSITLHDLKNELFDLDREELPAGSFDAVMRVLTDMEDDGLIRTDVQNMNMLKEWKQGFSIATSYNSAPMKNMTFDIGQKIREASKYYFTDGNRNPIIFFLDDPSMYAKEEREIVPYNLAIQEIVNIGYNYRSIGVYNALAVQSLGIIDENVAESYKIKIISPLFVGVDSLSKINIPRKAIDYLKSGQLTKNKEKHLYQHLLITETNEVVPFFPSTPGCNHTEEIYFPKEEQEVDEIDD